MHNYMEWVMSHALAIGSALLAALVAALGIVVRQAALHRPAADEASSGTTIPAYLSDRLWWAGTVASAAGYAFQAMALAHGSLLLVQPLLVSSLLFVLPLSAKGNAALSVMETHLQLDDWFAGDAYSVADIALYAYTHVAHEGNFDLSRYPAINRWLARVAQQPGHVPIDA